MINPAWESALLVLPYAEALFLTGKGRAAYSGGARETVQIACQCGHTLRGPHPLRRFLFCEVSASGSPRRGAR